MHQAGNNDIAREPRTMQEEQKRHGKIGRDREPSRERPGCRRDRRKRDGAQQEDQKGVRQKAAHDMFAPEWVRRRLFAHCEIGYKE